MVRISDIAASPIAHHIRRAVRQVARRGRFEPQFDAVLRRLRQGRARLIDLGWRRSIARLLRNGILVETAASWTIPDPRPTPVVMCLWNRPERIRDIINMLSRLDESTPVRLLLWNNNNADAPSYEWLKGYTPEGSLASVDLYTSPRNIGGLARFVAIRLLRNAGYSGPVILLDDDQDVESTFVSDMLRSYTPRSVTAWWAFALLGSYWQRLDVLPGELVDHAGTGGTVIDASLVDDDRFFLELPREYSFLEDQWMSFFASQSGWKMTKADTDITFVLDERNQNHTLFPLKDVFYSYQQATRASFVAGKPRSRAALRRGRIRPAKR